MSRIRADKISNKAGTGAVQLQYGAEVPVGYGITGAGTINVTGNIQSSSGFTGNVTGTAGGLTGTPDITVNNIVASAATFSGNVSVGGTLTYEDVTNVDSVGLITARNGINISDTTQASSTTTGALKVAGGVGIVKNLHVGGTINGDGSNLTGITQTTINNNADNRLITGSGTANTLEGESTLTYTPGSTYKLAITGADSYVNIGTNNKRTQIRNNETSTYLYSYADSTFHVALAGSGNRIQFDWVSGVMCDMVKNGAVNLYHNNNSKLSTTSTGVSVTGTVAATAYTGDGSALTGIGGTEHIHAQTLAVVGVTTLTGTIVNKVDSTTANSVIIGEEASANNTNTDSCVIIGKRAGYQNATGKTNNTFVGYQAGYAGGGTVSSNNTMVGSGAGLFMYGDAQYCTAIGQNAGYYNAANYCVSVGSESGSSRGGYNIAIGAWANGKGNSMSSSWMTYSSNTGSNQWGENNICIGYQANTPNENADNYIVIGNAQHTNFVVGRLGFEITAGITTNTGSLVVGAGVSAVGIVTASGGLSVGPGVLAEKVNVVSGSGFNGSYSHWVLSGGMVIYGGTNPASNTWQLNIIGNNTTTFNSLMAIGETTTMTMYAASDDTTKYMTAFKIDGTTQTVKWAGGTAPSAATGSGTDVYSMTIMKTADATFAVFGNLTNFA